MLKGLLNRVVGDSDAKEIAKLQPWVDEINQLEPEVERRIDALEASRRSRRDPIAAEISDEFRSRLASADTLDDIQPEAFAYVREVAKRYVDMRPFDVQLIGGIILHQGKVAEMRTGEGKTLVATMPIYLNALAGRGVHLVTVNDYLARRDALWMGPVYFHLGLSIGLLQSGREQPAYLYDPTYQREPYPGLRPVPRRLAYHADITYGTNNEFGFDYLRDNLALTLDRRVQRALYYAIVDEVDNIFIDEARTPLIISGPSGESVEDYSQFAAIARRLQPEVHYELDEKEHSVFLTEEGLAVVEQETGIENIYDEANYRYVHYMQQALKAQVLFLDGRDYIRQRKQIILIDQHTGRLMPSRRLSEGLHQAIEAKENVTILPRDVTSATVTIQNYFRMYEKLAGMSGTAVSEGEEFFKIYKLDVLAVPTNVPVIREDHADVVYRSEEAKLRAVARQILACHSRGQPVLVGTTSVEMSERLSKRLTGERLQMASLAPRVAYALQDADIRRAERSQMRETMDASLETMNSAAWRKLVRAMDVEPSAVTPGNLRWIADYMELPDDPSVRHRLEQALRDDIPHEILNAKEHTREASIIARAGAPGSVTIATNMAGRGVDIKLGGELTADVIHKATESLRDRGLDPYSATAAQMDSALAEVVPRYAQRREQVLEAGGLHILGTERHEARRIDNQLRGRAGRQGEPGSSRFYLSLEDDLMRRFGRREMLAKLMEQIGDDFPIEHGLVSKTIERAQSSVEGYNFDIRKHLLEYDDVLNRQRETIYGERLRILQSDDLGPEVWRMLERQADEYLGKHQEPDQRRFLFAGLDDVVFLTLPAPTAPFQGPLAFGGSYTAFPPFGISFVADQLAGAAEDEIEAALRELPRQAAADYGDFVRQSIRELAQTTLDSYDERLEHFQALLNEKIEDHLQLQEERGQPYDARRLAQHLGRTYPFKLTAPRSGEVHVDDLRGDWLNEIEIEYHQQTCLGLIDRMQTRLPVDAGGGLDRIRPVRLESAKVTAELERVRDLAAKKAVDDSAQQRLQGLALPQESSPDAVADFVDAVKGASRLDFARLDQLVAHVLGSYLDDLLGRYLRAVDEEQGSVQRDLQRLRDSLTGAKRGGRADLASLLRQMADLVHLEIEDIEAVASLALGHEFDKWAQKQLADLYAAIASNPLSGTSWTAIAEHLLATHYTQKQVYDRGHRRQTTWMPLLPFSFVAQASVADWEQDEVRDAVLASLKWAVEQREQTWGQRELARWSKLSLGNLDEETLDSLTRFLGEQELGDQRVLPVQDLSPAIEDHLRAVLALRQLEDRRISDLPHSDAVLARLGDLWEEELLRTPVGKLEAEWQERTVDLLRGRGYLDDPKARARWLEQPVEGWAEDARDQVAGVLGWLFVDSHTGHTISQLDADPQDLIVAYLQNQQLFVDEDRLQNFLVRQRLTDLPPETAQSALLHLAGARLEHLGRRKIANLDLSTRQAVIASLQRQGLFTDQERRDRFQAASSSLADLEPAERDGFGPYLARQRIDGGEGLAQLDGEAGPYIMQHLKRTGLLSDEKRVAELPGLRLPEVVAEGDSELGEQIVAQLHEDLARQLEADLAPNTMEEMPADLRRQIHEELDARNYFVDEDKVTWYERRTLAQLPSDLMRGLETFWGQRSMDELEKTPFRDVPDETRRTILELLDGERLLSGRAERLRLIQAGSLGELDESVRDAVSAHLGRQWLVGIRDRRPPNLPDPDGDAVWGYLRSQGYFSDDFKEELFAYQRLDEFDAEAQAAVKAGLTRRLKLALEQQSIGALPADAQAAVRKRLFDADHFTDEDRLHEVEERAVQDLAPDLRAAVEAALGDYLLQGLEAVPVDELPGDIQDSFWAYLDSTGYFVDRKVQNRTLDRRLVDLPAEYYEPLVQDVAHEMQAEIGDSPVADLSDDLRHGLREAVGALGYFESDEVRSRLLEQPLGELRREDLDGIAHRLGEARLDTWAGRRLEDLPEADREPILAHLQANDWFLDQGQLQRLLARPLTELEVPIRGELVRALRGRWEKQIARRKLANLDWEGRSAVRQTLQEEGLELDEGQLRPLRQQVLRELDQSIYHDLLRDLGSQQMAAWQDRRFGDLAEDQEATLRAFLGRRIMGRIERRVLLHTISRLWVDYLTDIEDLRRGIGLEAYAQRDPLVEYKRKAFELFEELGDNIRRTVVRSVFRAPPEPVRAL